MVYILVWPTGLAVQADILNDITVPTAKRTVKRLA